MTYRIDTRQHFAGGARWGYLDPNGQITTDGPAMTFATQPEGMAYTRMWQGSPRPLQPGELYQPTLTVQEIVPPDEIPQPPVHVEEPEQPAGDGPDERDYEDAAEMAAVLWEQRGEGMQWKYGEKFPRRSARAMKAFRDGFLAGAVMSIAHRDAMVAEWLKRTEKKENAQ